MTAVVNVAFQQLIETIGMNVRGIELSEMPDTLLEHKVLSKDYKKTLVKELCVLRIMSAQIPATFVNNQNEYCCINDIIEVLTVTDFAAILDE